MVYGDLRFDWNPDFNFTNLKVTYIFENGKNYENNIRAEYDLGHWSDFGLFFSHFDIGDKKTINEVVDLLSELQLFGQCTAQRAKYGILATKTSKIKFLTSNVLLIHMKLVESAKITNRQK